MYEIESYCLATLTVGAIIACFFRYKPEHVNMAILYIFCSMLNTVCFHLGLHNETSVNEYQLWIDLFWISAILSVIYYGFYRRTYTAYSIVVVAIFYLAGLQILTTLHFKNPQEISIAVCEGLFALLVALTMTFRVKNILSDHRFYLVASFLVYYGVAALAFINPELWWINSIATIPEAAFLLCGIFMPILLDKKKFLTDEEQFLIPNWVQDKIRFIEVPCLAEED